MSRTDPAQHDAGEEVEVRLLRDLDAVERTIVAIGSHDPVLDLAASLLRARDPNRTLVSGPVGSLGGLVAQRDGLCHLAGCHLLDPAAGEYTLPWIERVLPGTRVEVAQEPDLDLLPRVVALAARRYDEQPVGAHERGEDTGAPRERSGDEPAGNAAEPHAHPVVGAERGG